jgi:3-keto-disaccharide hydrolase
MSLTLRLIPAAVALALTLPIQTPEAGFTSLWNGKDWTDWKVANPSTFNIKDGAMVANGSQGHAFYDGPFRNHSFRNFELKVDVMTKPGSNGGIFILTEYQDKGWPAKGFEIQVNNTFKNDPVRTGSLYHVSDIKEAPAKDDEWFTEHIIVKGDTITIRVNDKEVVTWTSTPDSPNAKRMMPGTIALQAHDPGSTVFYKNIRIKPLD